MSAPGKSPPATGTGTGTDTGAFLPLRLPGLRVLVTAGAAGIGRSIAEGFAAAGARVEVCDIDATALATLAAERPDIGATRADVADPQAVAALFDGVSGRLGGLDVLVNNAGIAGPTASIADIAPEALRETLAVDVEGMFHCAARAVPMLRAAGGGSVINLSSVAGRLGFPLRTPYAAAKWGVVGFSRSLALELGRENVRVNALLPGHVDTPRFRAVAARRGASLGIPAAEAEARMLAPVALGRTVARVDIANMALYLASPFGASISGQAISVCGGVEMML